MAAIAELATISSTVAPCSGSKPYRPLPHLSSFHHHPSPPSSRLIRSIHQSFVPQIPCRVPRPRVWVGFYPKNAKSKRICSRSFAKNGAPGPRAMFTGIVEEMGTVVTVGPVEDGGFEMTIQADVALQELKLGDSISVNGTCLTVTRFDSNSFSVGLAPETLRKTSLGEANSGSLVNLERSLQPQSRMGGHFVQGHVDGTGTIVSLDPEGDSLWVKIRTSPEILRYIVPKGFIAVDGTSLTVVGVLDDESSFTFMLVAYTQQKVGIPGKKVGSKVNLEVDILGKYVERLLEGYKAAVLKAV